MRAVPFNESVLQYIHDAEVYEDGDGSEFANSASTNGVYDRHTILWVIKEDKPSAIYKQTVEYMKKHPERKFFYANVNYIDRPISFSDVLAIQLDCSKYHIRILKKETLCERILDLLRFHDYSEHHNIKLFIKCLHKVGITTNLSINKTAGTKFNKLRKISNRTTEQKVSLKKNYHALTYEVPHPERKYLYANLDKIKAPISLFDVKRVQKYYNKKSMLK